MKRLFSILLFTGMIMASTISYPNSYKDFTIGAFKGASSTLLVVGAVNLMKNMFSSFYSFAEKAKQHPYLYKNDDGIEVVKELASSTWNGKWWIPVPLYGAGLASFGAMLDSVGIKLKNDNEKFGYFMGSATTIAGIVSWYLYTKK